MQGDAKARQAAIEEQVAVQWLAARMQVMAGAGKLKPLNHWLAEVRPRPKLSLQEKISALQDAAARGLPIKITKVKG